jgi:hypothetical protein
MLIAVNIPTKFEGWIGLLLKLIILAKAKYVIY